MHAEIMFHVLKRNLMSYEDIKKLFNNNLDALELKILPKMKCSSV